MGRLCSYRCQREGSKWARTSRQPVSVKRSRRSACLALNRLFPCPDALLLMTLSQGGILGYVEAEIVRTVSPESAASPSLPRPRRLDLAVSDPDGQERRSLLCAPSELARDDVARRREAAGMGLGRGRDRAGRSVPSTPVSAGCLLRARLTLDCLAACPGWRPEQASALQYWVSTREPPSEPNDDTSEEAEGGHPVAATASAGEEESAYEQAEVEGASPQTT